MTQSKHSTTKHYQQLTPEGRGEIKVYLNAGKSQADIARLINRSRSTISREIKRGAIRQRNSDYLFSPNTLRTRASLFTIKPVRTAVLAD